VAFNYGSRQEIANARSGWRASRGRAKRDPASMDADTLGRYLDAPDIPDPDLIIRTSGEQRLSNFLMWQAAYSELVFVPIHWPDFDKAALGGRDRRIRQRSAGSAVWRENRIVPRAKPRRRPCRARLAQSLVRVIGRWCLRRGYRHRLCRRMAVGALVTLAAIGLYVEWLMIVGGAREKRVVASGVAAPRHRRFCLASGRLDASLVVLALGLGPSRCFRRSGASERDRFVYAAAAQLASILVRFDQTSGFAALMLVLLVVWGHGYRRYFAGRASAAQNSGRGSARRKPGRAPSAALLPVL